MLDLPYGTHRGLIEPLTGKKHQRTILITRFFKMIQKIRVSKKPILKKLLSEIELDVSSTTGRNLRKIMLETGNSRIAEVDLSEINDLKYFKLEDEEEWRIEMIKYLLEERLERHLDDEEEDLLEVVKEFPQYMAVVHFKNKSSKGPGIVILTSKTLKPKCIVCHGQDCCLHLKIHMAKYKCG